ncbi:GIY-YIG nuclease family protein [Botryobacter ruber]|uniref:excinuclease ABC subunit C n=1 Tax=Botryobacter ruber TaxID=2171629 RepID=UPI000E0C7B22|nr:excinuclease ABC subunit C [Botryobacter ruber]
MATTDPHFFVYIFGDEPRSGVDIGIAGDLQQHVQEVTGNVKEPAPVNQKLVYYEYYIAEEVAVAREQQLKQNTNDANFHLIESMNPNWLDLSDTLE